ncbi:MAG: YciC family protein [Candidatus Omnitrophota bacterium]
MANQGFSISDSISFGWESMKKNIGFFIALLLICGITGGILDAMQKMAEQAHSGLMNFVVFIISLVLNILISMGMIKIALSCARGQKPNFNDLVNCYPLFFKYLFASLLYALIVFGGLLLLIVPGIIWAIQFGFYGYYLVDEKVGIIESLSKSSALTGGVKWDLLCFHLLCFLLNLAGALCLLVGLFATVPTTMVALAYVYHALRQDNASVKPGAPVLSA